MQLVPDISALVVFVIVWLLVVVLSRVFFKPLSRIIDERRKRLDADGKAAEEALERAQQDIRRIEDGLKEARAAAEGLRERAEIEALKERNRVVQEVQAEGRARVEKAKRELEAKVEQLKKELDAKTEELASEIEKKLMN
jgi:F-type H+-transporting ATPase subunit b